MVKIAVFYLARLAEGLPAVERFAKSYAQYPAGEPHDFFVIIKGEAGAGTRAGLTHIFRNIKHSVIEVSDDGYDIQAYLKAAAEVGHEEVCFFNTFTTLQSPDWLKKLAYQFHRPGVGVAGMTASFESIFDSQAKLNKVVWLASTGKVKFHQRLAEQFSSIINFHVPGWMKPTHSTYQRWRRKAADLYHRRILFNSSVFEPKYEAYWNEVTGKNGSVSDYAIFAGFPNPHIRSTGFLTTRKYFLEFKDIGKTKMDCLRFESGPDGFSNTLMKRGLGLILVGADGAGYPISQWVNSRTFRLGDQSNLMASDNQVQTYRGMGKWEQETMRQLSWGEYSGAAPEGFIIKGFESQAVRPPGLIAAPPTKTLKFSVVIPTHNRLGLLKDALETIRRQDYPNCEVVVFDNASTDAIGEYVKTLGDSRIRYLRADEFLPVTDSWNRAIDLATGDYVILIGDDDGLVPNFFTEANTLANDFAEPDFVYSSMYQFMHPGVLPGVREGFLIELKNGFFFAGRLRKPFILDSNDAQKAWKGSVGFERNFTFNMQAFVFKRSFLDHLRVDGSVFHSPFPDYYLANLAMAKGNKILVNQEPLTIAGVSTESYGYTLFNGLEKEGASLLNSKIAQDPLFTIYEPELLPGREYLNNYILTMGHVAKNAPSRQSTRPGIARYRRHQIFLFIKKQNSLRWMKTSEAGRKLWSLMKFNEKVWAMTATFLKVKKLDRLLEKMEDQVSDTSFVPILKRLATGKFARVTEVFESLKVNYAEPRYRYLTAGVTQWNEVVPAAHEEKPVRFEAPLTANSLPQELRPSL